MASLAIRCSRRARRLQDLGKIEAAGDSGNSGWHGLRGGLPPAQDHTHTDAAEVQNDRND